LSGPPSHPIRRNAIGLVLKALNADVVFRSLPIAADDRDRNGQVVAPEILEKLQAIAVELATRAVAPSAA
jgi:hypothetical protein